MNKRELKAKLKKRLKAGCLSDYQIDDATQPMPSDNAAMKTMLPFVRMLMKGDQEDLQLFAECWRHLFSKKVPGELSPEEQALIDTLEEAMRKWDAEEEKKNRPLLDKIKTSIGWKK
ncbi:MAG: hypothetical protein KAW41_06320 [Candidatus Diapherotrites archaeon]|nr:hypothetical protein [Candidatus Diapherotrites archaeon]